MEAQNISTQRTDRLKLQNTIEAGKRRIKELDVIISHIYEDNILGKISDERYMRMSAGYEKEQKDLIQTIADSEQRLKEMEQTSVDLKLLLAALREATDITELNQTLVNKLIQKIVVHGNEKKHSRGGVKIDIYFTAVGMVSLPDEQELQKIMEEVRHKHKNTSKIIRLTA